MLVYRIGRTKFAEDLTGEGARLNGGRWNHKLIPCIYTSESRALALLEYTANVNIEDIPRALSVSVFEIPDNEIFEIPLSGLPGDWALSPAPSSAKELGSALLATHLVVKVPSAIVADEFNYLLNPRHPKSSALKILSIRDFVYDVRLKLK
ncbi:RES family NAD+ phosphorylase [Dyadobacter psychrotolerans]|uniref:RES domain-containing protein n=1 Tax=Dyadobacter psychrotolerans TaxID=2541721 RepID=A0A4V2Z3N2_9BACT|nr:RES family NAD+ phosphorylase [Dyadobacter psychrotolerans]TDE13318.1 RES domain-containing protein [Dyadobacter psychrotolerans]